MANYFYCDANGKKQGPFNEQHLQEQAAEGTIRPSTMQETENGSELVAARQIISQRHFAKQDVLGFFDFGFTRFITNTWISFIWMLTVGITFLAWGLLILAWGLSIWFIISQGGKFAVGGFLMRFLMILVSPLVAAIYLLFTRMGLEFMVVIFRIETHLRELKDNSEKAESLRAVGG